MEERAASDDAGREQPLFGLLVTLVYVLAARVRAPCDAGVLYWSSHTNACDRIGLVRREQKGSWF